MNFRLCEDPIQSEVLRSDLRNPTAGALVTFEGWVRNHNREKEVISLEYEAAEGICRNEFGEIEKEAGRRFEIIEASCAHRVGHLQIGDMAVWVGVVAAHRADAFDTCRYLIDEIKHRLPIWKKEHYEDGASDWINNA